LPTPDLSWGYALFAANAVLYVLLGYQLLRWKRYSRLQAAGLPEAFGLLWKELMRIDPAMPAGSTWEEAIAEVSRMNVEVDWSKLNQALRAYEAHRYGGEPITQVSYNEVLILARELKRKR
jgi:hypothetical protein